MARPVIDRRAVRHHYDVSNDYFALFLDDSMTYSCAIFSRGAKTLEEAQWAKRELICAKLQLKQGERAVFVTILCDSGDKYLSERFWEEE